MKTIYPSINFHITKSCNMKCKFCFATFNDLNISKYDVEKSKKIIYEVAKCKFKKITFAGGEPTLVKELPELIQYAKELGLITAIVTNGSRLQDPLLNKLAPYLDWVALSIDTINDELNLKSGRALNNGKTVLTESYFIELIDKLKSLNIKVKINTVVSKYNSNDDMNSFILKSKPDRWKILQALKIDGQNDKFEFEIQNSQFNKYLKRHKMALPFIEKAIEPTELIKGSYLMISPEGKLYDNTGNSYTYSNSILDVGLEEALKQVNFDLFKFMQRGGFYEYENKLKIQKESVQFNRI